MYAWRARDALRLPARDRRPDRRPHQPLRARPVLPLPERAPEPDQLELRAVRAPRHGHRRHGAARERLPRAGGALLRRHHQRALVPGGSPNLGPGYRFHYLPHRPPTHPFNLDSAEYASETCHFILYYEQALRGRAWRRSRPSTCACCAPGSSTSCAAYWTHGGYLNWDTGYGFKRWHAGRTWALAQQGLLAIAAVAALPHRAGDWARGRSTCSTAGWRSTSGCRARPPRRQGHRAVEPLRRQRRAARPEHPGAVRRAHAGERGARRGARARVAMQAPRAAAPVLVRRRHRPPRRSPRRTTRPPCCPVSQRAFPYGGMELCRLYDGDQRVVSNVGGRPWASFGVLVRDSAAKEIATSQRPTALPPLRPPLAAAVVPPRARGRLAQPYPPRPYAGPFETLVAQGRTESRRGGASTPRTGSPRAWIETRWAIARRRARRATRSTCCSRRGARRARVEAILRGGRRVTLAAPGASAGAASRCATSSTSTSPARRPATSSCRPASARARRRTSCGPRRSPRRPGPARRSRCSSRRASAFRRLGLAVRIAPARGTAGGCRRWRGACAAPRRRKRRRSRPRR